MNEKAKAARREYHRRWQQANKDRVREYQRTYWERQAAALEDEPGRQQDDSRR